MGDDRKTVLIAEDNPGIRDLVSVVLSDIGLEVISAGDGEEAVKTAKKTLPDLIILDIMLPEMDGWEIATRLLTDSKTSDIPIVFLTARASRAEQMRGWAMPIFEYITKPFDIDDLVAKVESVLAASPEQRPELREQLRRQKLRMLLGMANGRMAEGGL